MELTAAKDNTLYQSATGATSNGSGEGLFAGRTNGDSLRRALIQFDIAGAVPAGAIIESVELKLSVNRSATESQRSSLHRVTSDWGEGASDAGAQEGKGADAEPGDATWTHAFSPDQAWQKAGGDFLPTTSAELNVFSDGAHTWGSSRQMVADVQAWVDNPDSNFGWLLLGNEAETKSAKRFASRESRTASTRPVLIIRFTPPS